MSKPICCMVTLKMKKILYEVFETLLLRFRMQRYTQSLELSSKNVFKHKVLKMPFATTFRYIFSKNQTKVYYF